MNLNVLIVVEKISDLITWFITVYNLGLALCKWTVFCLLPWKGGGGSYCMQNTLRSAYLLNHRNIT